MGILTLSRKATVFACFLGLVAVAGCASAEKEKEVQRLQAQAAYEQAMKNLQDKRVSLGLASLQQAVSLDPENAVFRNALGVVFLDLRRPADAQAEFQKAVDLNPSYAEAQHNLGLAQAEQGRHEQAIVGYRKALTLPTYTTPEVAYNNMGNSYFSMSKFKEAEESYRAALQLNGRLPSALYGLGMSLSRQGRPEEAKAAFSAARDVDASSPFGQAATEALKGLGVAPK